MSETLSAYREQWLALQRRHRAGEIDRAAHDSARAVLERQIAEAVMAELAVAEAAKADAAGAPAGMAVESQAAAWLAARSQAEDSSTASPVPRAAPPAAGRGLWALTLAGIAIVGGIGYAVTGSPGRIGQPPPGFENAQPSSASASAPGLDRAQFEAMVAKLAARLQLEPGDGEGFGMLGRSYMALGRHTDAGAAYRRALEIRPNDAALLTDYADATAVANGSTLEGQPTQLLERALQIDPGNLKALALSGTAAFNRGDFVQAVRHWDRVVLSGPPDSPLVEMSRSGAAEARERGKLPAATAAGAADVAAAAVAAPASAANAAGAVSGSVQLAPELRAQAAPGDTVYIFARAAEGGGMPLAILRKQVKDLPLDFTLDDSLAMSPAARLSSAGRVVVSARVSKSGQALPQPGDLEGASAALAVGTSGVVVVIKTRIP